MKYKYKIAWQKYEDVIEKQLSSPVLLNLMKHMYKFNNINQQEETDELDNELTFDDDDEEDDHDDEEKYDAKDLLMFPLSEKMLNELSILSSFDCWIGHTNFDITHGIKDKLNTVPGVEMLKIFSRYRFFIGIGKLFDFTEVRKTIENEILPKETET